MATNKNTYYGYTINVSPKKILNNKAWQDYLIYEQEMILRKAIDIYKPCIGYYEPGSHDVHFELTKKGMMHAHGGIVTTEDEIKLFQQNIHKMFGFPKLDPSICFHYSETKINNSFWKRYMEKEAVDKKAIDFLLNLKIDRSYDSD